MTVRTFLSVSYLFITGQLQKGAYLRILKMLFTMGSRKALPNTTRRTNTWLSSIPDAFCCAENMVLEATELGLASCIIARGEETFANPEGQAYLREWNIPENYEARCFVLLGYCNGTYPAEKPRKAGRSTIIES